MDKGQISQNLIEQYGEKAILAGIDAADRRQREFVFNHAGEERSFDSPTIEVESDNPPSLSSHAGDVKIWPMVLLAAIQNRRGGAARVWYLAKSIDPEGSGKVRQDALQAHLVDLGVGDRKIRRWLRAALDRGLMWEKVYQNGEKVFRLVGWARGAGMLGCEKIGSPASVSASALVSPGWRAHVWAGYLTTLEGQVISQKTKRNLTGVDERTQRNYQSMLAIERRQNYSNTDLSELGDITEKHLFINPKTKKVVQKLPDIFIVPSEVARSLPKGRSRNAQRELNSRMLGDNSSYPATGLNDSVVRLFHETKRGAESAIRRLDEFGEVFWCKHTWENANQWGVRVQL